MCLRLVVRGGGGVGECGVGSRVLPVIKVEKLGKAYTGQNTKKECKTKASPADTGKMSCRSSTRGL